MNSLKSALCISFILCLTLLYACKKNKEDIPTLYGSWVQDLPYSTDPLSKPSLGFLIGRDSIQFYVRFVTNEITYVKGTYRTDGNKFITNFKVVELRDANGQFVSIRPADGTYFKDATYLVTKNKFTLTYDGNPPGVPGLTTMSFLRQLPD
ncbi:MAG: hypothetical protein V4687_18040 [Bacteroidota bacterium]